MDMADATDEHIGQLVKDKQMAVMVNNGNSQKVIPEEDLDKYLNDGWVFVSNTPSGKVVVKLPQK